MAYRFERDGKAVVYSTDSGAEIDARRWRDALAGLPDVETPIHLKFHDIPRTATWKVKRVALRRRLFNEAPIGKGSWT